MSDCVCDWSDVERKIMIELMSCRGGGLRLWIFSSPLFKERQHYHIDAHLLSVVACPCQRTAAVIYRPYKIWTAWLVYLCPGDRRVQ